MHVLITGGAGYVGSHAAKALQKAGHLPVVLDNLSRGSRDAVKWGPLVEANSSGRGYSVREVVAMMERVSGRRVPFREVARRAGDPARLVADVSRAVEALA